MQVPIKLVPYKTHTHTLTHTHIQSKHNKPPFSA